MTLIGAGLAGTLLLVGLLLNAALGWWWADPLTALVLAALAVEEGLQRVAVALTHARQAYASG